MLFEIEYNDRVNKILNNIDENNKNYIQICIDKIKEKQNRELTSEEIRLIETIAPIMKER